MSHPIFSAIILPLPAHAQESNPAIHSNTRYLCDYKPLLTVEPAEPAAQGIILIKTANAVITLFSNIHLTDKKWISKKQGFMKANPNMTESVNGMLLFITSILAQWRHYPRLTEQIKSKFVARWEVLGSRHYAKPPARYGQVFWKTYPIDERDNCCSVSCKWTSAHFENKK